MNFFRSILFLLVGLLGAGCERSTTLQEWMTPNGKLKVLCTTAMCAELVEEIGQGQIDCLTLIQGESDPHSYQLVKGDDEKLQVADLIFYSGLGLEHGPSLSSRLKESSKAFSLGDAIAKMYPQEIIIYGGSVDPHIWMDISLWQAALPGIVAALQAKLPEHADLFQANADRLKEKLEVAHDAIKKSFQAIAENRRYLVSSHEAFNYFVRAYLATDSERADGSWTPRSMAPEGLAPESQLSTQDIQRLVDHIIRYKVTTLFAESNVSRDSLIKLVDACQKLGYSVQVAKEPLYVDAMGNQDDYIKMMLYDADTIVRNL